MNRHILVAFLVSVVFSNEVEIITTNDYGALHLSFGHNTAEDATTDCHVASERTFLIHVRAIDCLNVMSYSIA